MSKYTKLAEIIVENVGGRDNIKALYYTAKIPIKR